MAYPAVAHGQRTHTRGAERCALRVGRQPTTKRQHVYARAPTGQARTSSSSACRQSRCRRRSSPRAARGWCSSGAPRGWRPRCGKASRRCSMTRVGPVDLRMTIPHGRHETESEAKTRLLRESRHLLHHSLRALCVGSVLFIHQQHAQKDVYTSTRLRRSAPVECAKWAMHEPGKQPSREPIVCFCCCHEAGREHLSASRSEVASQELLNAVVHRAGHRRQHRGVADHPASTCPAEAETAGGDPEHLHGVNPAGCGAILSRGRQCWEGGA